MPGAGPAAAEGAARHHPGLTGPLSARDFAALMHPLGPFGVGPRLVLGVSGGPHSLALALLADDWARARGGAVLAAICDHGLRPESGAEAEGTAATLRALGFAAEVMRLGLAPGPRMQERARAARLSALLGACVRVGAPWLLLGHHRGDQAETVLLRALDGSGAAGLAGMAAARAEASALVLRPLLGIPPERLEATVAAAGLAPVRDPSNLDPRFTRVLLRGPAGMGEAALAEAAGRFAARRETLSAEVAARLARAAALHSEGFARIDLPALGQDGVALGAMRALIRAVAGRAHPVAEAAVAVLLARGAGTLAGAVLRRDGVLAREEAAIGAPVPAEGGAVWDGRFRMVGPGDGGCTVGPLGAEATRLPRAAWLPAAVARTLPAIRREMMLVAVPMLSYPDPKTAVRFRMLFSPAGGPVT